MEKYGTIPPRFTKDWWAYIWYYYKWHFLGGAFAAILIVSFCVQCATAIKYDATVTYVGKQTFSPETQEIVEQAIAETIDDATGNGKTDVLFQVLAQETAGESQDYQYAQAIAVKTTLEYTAGETFLFLLSKEQMDSMLSTGWAEIFSPVCEWNSGDENQGYFVNLQGSRFFADLGIATDDLYLAVRAMREDEQEDAIIQKRLENAKKLAQVLMQI